MSYDMNRIRKYAGKERKDVSNPCITAREAIDIANHVVRLEAENSALKSAMREIYEVWAGSDGFIPETAPEAYLSKLIKDIAGIARAYLCK